MIFKLSIQDHEWHGFRIKLSLVTTHNSLWTDIRAGEHPRAVERSVQGLCDRSLLISCACLAILWPPRWPSGKASASRAEGPGFKSRLYRDFFGVESYL